MVRPAPGFMQERTMAAIPTIKVQDGSGGFCVINASDFDEKIHKVYSEQPAKAKTAEPEAAAPAPKRTARKPKG